MKQGDKVYALRGTYWERAEVDHTYVSCTGFDCVAFTSGSNLRRDQVKTMAEYWEHHREYLEREAHK